MSDLTPRESNSLVRRTASKALAAGVMVVSAAILVKMVLGTVLAIAHVVMPLGALVAGIWAWLRLRS